MPYVPDLSTVLSVLVTASTALVLGWGAWSLVVQLRRRRTPGGYDEPPPMKPRRPTGRQWWG
jgi:hypothetical protein